MSFRDSARPALAGAALACLLTACMLGDEARPAFPGRFPGLDTLPLLARLDSSRKALEWMKSASGDSYAYWVKMSNPLAGSNNSTRVTVRSGIAVERRITSTKYDQEAGGETPAHSYVESGAEVGRTDFGPPPLILDSLYAVCERALSAATERDRIFFSLDGNFIVSRCGTIAHGLQDAFHPQVYLSGLEWER
jgi:hypothetical protein